MKAYRSLWVALVLSTVAASDGLAAPEPPPRHVAPPSSAGKVAVTHESHAAPGDAAKTGERPGAVGNRQTQTPGGGKGTSSINGTGIGARHSPSINGTGMGAQHKSSINGTGIGARH